MTSTRDITYGTSTARRVLRSKVTSAARAPRRELFEPLLLEQLRVRPDEQLVVAHRPQLVAECLAHALVRDVAGCTDIPERVVTGARAGLPRDRRDPRL